MIFFLSDWEYSENKGCKKRERDRKKDRWMEGQREEGETQVACLQETYTRTLAN